MKYGASPADTLVNMIEGIWLVFSHTKIESWSHFRARYRVGRVRWRQWEVSSHLISLHACMYFKIYSVNICHSNIILNWYFHFDRDSSDCHHGTGPRRQDQFVWFSSAAVIVECHGSCMERKTTWKVNWEILMYFDLVAKIYGGSKHKYQSWNIAQELCSFFKLRNSMFN